MAQDRQELIKNRVRHIDKSRHKKIKAMQTKEIKEKLKNIDSKLKQKQKKIKKQWHKDKKKILKRIQ